MASGGDVVTQVRAVQRDTLATRQAANIFPHDFLKPAFKVANQVESSLGEAPHRGRMASRAQRTPAAKLIKASRRKLHSQSKQKETPLSEFSNDFVGSFSKSSHVLPLGATKRGFPETES